MRIPTPASRSATWWCAIVAILLLAAPASGQRHPNQQHGVTPEKLYSNDGLDTVDLFSGNLMLTVPLKSFELDGGFRYGVGLSYNSTVWDFETRVDFALPGQPTYTRADPDRFSNAGLGWRLSWGNLYAPNQLQNRTPDKWLFVDGDGSQRIFYPTLHIGETVDSKTWYTRDGSYLRLRLIGSTNPLVAEVDLPDGTIKKFTRPSTNIKNSFRISEMRDRFNNRVTFSYRLHNPSAPGDPNNPPSGGEAWDLWDGYRTQTILFRPIYYGLRVPRLVVDRVRLAAFDTQIADYFFVYNHRLIPRSCKNDDPLTLDSSTQTYPVHVSLLTQIVLPDGSSYRMDGASDYNTACGGTGMEDLPGTLARLRLATLGYLSWTYREYRFPHGEVAPPSPEPPLFLDSTVGIHTKSLLNANGGCTDAGGSCTWEYEFERVSTDPWVRKMTVTTPLGHDTVSYFSDPPRRQSTPTWTGWQYALPISATMDSFHPNVHPSRFLSQEIFEGRAALGNRKRSVLLQYEHDKLPSALAASQDWYNTNRRVRVREVVYEDDSARYSDWRGSSFDGVGHHRTAVTGSNFLPSNNFRTTTTSYSPGLGTYNIDADTNAPAADHAFTMLEPSAPWVLGTYSQRLESDSYDKQRTEYCFEPATGFLSRSRILKDHPDSTTSGRSGDDLLAVYTRDSKGNVIWEQHYGGDGAQLETGSDVCGVSLPAQDKYRLNHTYQHGVLATTQYRDAANLAGGSLAFLTIDQTIDQRSGLVKASRDTAGLETSLTYDTLGRLLTVEESNDQGSAAWTGYEYTRAQPGGPTFSNVRTTEREGDANGAELTQTVMWFDSAGRIDKEERLMPGGAWSTRLSGYYATGHRAFVSQLGYTSKRTHYRNYDAVGRPGQVEAPDGTVTDLAYTGDRVVSRTVDIGTTWNGGAVTPTEFTSTERYDSYRRLYQVVEPSGGLGALVTTTYAYDVGGRLSSAATTSGSVTQTRLFCQRAA